MRLLITGASGFLGGHLMAELKARGHTVYGLSRHGPDIHCDICQLPDEIGIHPKVDAVVHSAAILSFNKKLAKDIWNVNYNGTMRLLSWMEHNEIPRIFHISTAYLIDRNDYEMSKRYAELAIKNTAEKWKALKFSIFRPGIIIADSQLRGLPPPAGAYVGVRAIERAKIWFENKTGAPPIKLTARLEGNPRAHLNLIPVDIVAREIANVIDADATGVYYITHPRPPTLKSLEEPVSKAIGIEVKFCRKFSSNPLDRMVAAMIKDLLPYLDAADIPSDIQCKRLSKEFLYRTAKAFLQG